MNCFQGVVDSRSVLVLAPGRAEGRWLAFEGCPARTLPHRSSEWSNTRCGVTYFWGGLDLKSVCVALGLAGRRWVALAGCHLTLPLFFLGLGA